MISKIFTILFICCAFLVNTKAQENDVLLKNLRKHVYTLAADSMQGRATGMPGQAMAAKYIAGEFAKSGLETIADSGYFQYYNLSRLRKNSAIVKSHTNMLFWPWHYHFVSGYEHNDTINTRLLFIGKAHSNELNELPIQNKALAFVSNSPQEAYARIKEIRSKYGNKNYFVILPDKNKALDLAWSGYYQLSNFTLGEQFNDAYERRLQEEWTDLPPGDSLNIFYCFPNTLKELLDYTDRGLESISNKSMGEEFYNIPSPNISIIINYKNAVEEKAVENVVAYIPGENSDETVVVTAHYDHIGIEFGQVNYGADDNASGTAALIEAARILKQEYDKGNKPDRNILFIAFSGEELGLLGSKYYVNNPIAPLNKTVLNLNMDMLGRWDEKHAEDKSFVYLLSAGTNKRKVYKAGKKLNLHKDFTVTKKAGPKEKVVFKYGSDHYSFIEKDVPIVVLFTGLHPDYHTPYDTPNKINYSNLRNITELVSNLVFYIADEPQKFPIHKKKK